MIAIKDFKMPVNCEVCFARLLAWCRLDEEGRMVIPALPDESFEGRPDWCPLVDVPDINVGKCSEFPNNSDCVSRRAAIDALLELVEARRTWISTEDARKEISGIDASMCAIHDLPSVQPKTTQVLAEVLDGCPLLHPCDELCKPEGWCMEHCKEGQNGPDKDCWMRYAEVMASERSD